MAGAQVIGKGRVWVPAQLYKRVYDAGSNRAWADRVEKENEARAGKPISYREFVQRTGLEFLPGLNPQEGGECPYSSALAPVVILLAAAGCSWHSLNLAAAMTTNCPTALHAPA